MPFSRAIAPMFAVASMCSIQLGAALSLSTTIKHGTISTTWLRLCFAAVALAAIVRPPLHTYSRQHWAAAVALGSAAACMTLCFFEAVRRVPLVFAVAVSFLGPIAVATFGERKLRRLMWPVFAVAGVLLLARQDGMWVVSPIDLVFPIGSALGWVAHIVLKKHVGMLFDGLEGLTASLIAAAVVTGPFGILLSGGHLPAGQLVNAAYIAVLVPLVPYVLKVIALRRMSASAFGVVMCTEPAIAAAIGFLVLAQPISRSQIVGTLCVVGACIGAVVGGISAGSSQRVRV
ncbi:EamA family transporter [Paraburkholderia franconis]|uniref:EamA family transporter n=1 Tax=Paraburkholderia franconis TaxID=2654983 RepID=UPI002AB32025|nr:EamA family transporter [Paraburkholderia franconis]